jgi:MFS family permease
MSNGYYIDYSNPSSLHNWIDTRDLRCASDLSIGALGSSFFIGILIGSSFLSSYGDTIGRKKMI